MSETMLRVEGVSRHFPGAERPVLDGVDLSVEAGQSVAITGPSGSGKSTLLLIMGALDPPDAGRVWIGDQEVTGLHEHAATAVRRDCIGFVFQDHHLLPHCTALENVLLPTMMSVRTADDRGHAEHLLESLGLEDRMGHLPGQLATGQRQRVAVARALIREPSVILADEPTGALDPHATETLLRLLFATRGESALVMVTHAVEVAAMADRTFRLDRGVLTEQTR